MTPETRTKKEIKAYLDNLKDCAHWPYTNSGYGITGFPDRFGVQATLITPQMVGMRVGRFFAIEVKAPGNTPTKFQKVILDQIAAAGGLAIVAWSVEDVRRVLA